MPLAEESARIDKRAIVTSRVRVRTSVETVEELASATLEGESVEIVRVPIDREVTNPPAVRTEDGVTIVPILEEVLMVEKRLVLKEELHIHRRPTRETIAKPVKLRRQRAIIERAARKTNPNDSKE